MRAKPILLLGGTCLLGVAVVRLLADMSTPAAVTATSNPPASTVAAPSEQPAEARALPSATGRPSAARAVATPEAQGLTPQQRDEQTVAKIDANLAERLGAERIDAKWAHETEAAIANTLARPTFAGLRLDGVRCGATLCRVALTANEQVADVGAVVEELTSSQPFRAGGFLRFTGKRAVTMFVARKGTSLPPPPPS